MSGARGKERRRVAWAVGVLAVFLLAEIIVVVAVVVSPAATGEARKVVAGAAQRWNGTRRAPGLRDRIVDGVSGTAHRWAALLTGASARPSSRPRRDEFTSCVGCHPDYASTRRFRTTYFDHPRHDQLGVTCGRCHTDNDHPDPAVPAETVCASCHSEVRRGDACRTCHPPGSLPHFSLLGYPRGGEVRCTTCHAKGIPGAGPPRALVRLPALDGRDRSVCTTCHQATDCARCHGAPHPTGWLVDHPIRALDQGTDACIGCHSLNYCSDRCHAGQAAPPVAATPPTGGDSP